MSILKIKENGIWKSIIAIKGEKGDDGVGVPAGGSTGQMLKKKSGTDYDTEWDDVSAHTHTKNQIIDFPTFADVATSGNYNDLSNKPSIPSAVTEETVSGWGFTKNTGTYSKPASGIPATDFDSTVQSSLDKADTALQLPSSTSPLNNSFYFHVQEGTPASLKKAAWGSVVNKLINDEDFYVKAATGIPTADLASVDSVSDVSLRQSALVSTETAPTTNGQINWTYE